jgi:hypothetical protein
MALAMMRPEIKLSALKPRVPRGIARRANQHSRFRLSAKLVPMVVVGRLTTWTMKT